MASAGPVDGRRDGENKAAIAHYATHERAIRRERLLRRIGGPEIGSVGSVVARRG